MERFGGSYWTGGSWSRCIDVVGVLRGVLAVLYGDSFQVELEPASLGSLNSTCHTVGLALGTELLRVDEFRLCSKL